MNLRRHDKIGLALGSGAARGLAHIGVLKVLEGEQVPLTAIAGTSIGALIGALYASGVTVDQMEEIVRNVDWRDLARLVNPVFPGSGLIDGKKVARFIAGLLPVQRFDGLHIPLAVTATDIETGEDLFIKQGDLVEAVRAAIAFPGIFPPVPFGDRFLVDGGLCNPVPVDVVRDFDCNKVIGVCAIPKVHKPRRETFLASGRNEKPSGSWRALFTAEGVERLFRDIWPAGEREEKDQGNGSGKERKPPGLLKVFAQSIAIMENQINELRLGQNHFDLLLRPRLENFNLFEFNRAAEAIRAGEEEARAKLPAILQMCGRD